MVNVLFLEAMNIAEQKFQPGDEVQLKSGGSRMTIVGHDVYESYETRKNYKCRWFSDKHQPPRARSPNRSSNWLPRRPAGA